VADACNVCANICVYVLLQILWRMKHPSTAADTAGVTMSGGANTGRSCCRCVLCWGLSPNALMFAACIPSWSQAWCWLMVVASLCWHAKANADLLRRCTPC
jgi:thiosulfate reductase cytochrome b subunit